MFLLLYKPYCIPDSCVYIWNESYWTKCRNVIERKQVHVGIQIWDFYTVLKYTKYTLASSVYSFDNEFELKQFLNNFGNIIWL